ncbi:MAG: YdbC family protein [Bacillota bacterium]|jgi:hypothetical protein
MNRVPFQIIKHIAVLSVKGDVWKKELNFMKWSNYKPKYDIRDWARDRKTMKKGITLSFEELELVVKLLQTNLDNVNRVTEGIIIGETKVKCELLLQCGVLSDSKGWTKELNIVRWGNNNPCFDLRYWGPDKNKIGKGTTLSHSEACSLIEAFNKLKADVVKNSTKLDLKSDNVNDIVEELFI